ncbi:MAG: metallophosphoesterase [Acidobacteriota bacterium]
MMGRLFGSSLRMSIVIGCFVLLAAGGIGTARSAQSELNFAVIGDSGTGEAAQYAIARRMVAEREKTPFDFVIMLGDNIYGGGLPKYFKPRFEEPYKDLLGAGVKFYAALGNHDAPYAEVHSKYEHFNMGGKRYYSFNKGGDLVEFFVLDTNETKTSELGKEQLTWLETELAASKAKWKVAYFHHAIYSSGKMHSPYARLRGQIEPLFVKYGVSVVFAGHFHVYERLKPQKGVQYFTAGSGGKLMRGNLDPKSTLREAGNDQAQVFLMVSLNEDRMQVKALSADGKVIDEAAIAPRKAAAAQ